MQRITIQPSKRESSLDLLSNGERMLTLTFNPLLKTVRIEFEDHDLAYNKRMFMLERDGFLRNRVSLKNEYGVTIGFMEQERWQSHEEGFIEFDEERLNYVIDKKSRELIIFRDTREEPTLTCTLSENHKPSLSIDIDKSLILAVGLYLHQHQEMPVLA